MNGLVSDSQIVLTSLHQLSKNQFRSKVGVRGDDCYDILCVAMETKFQYISFERSKQVAILDITVIDNSLIDSGNTRIFCNCELKLALVHFYLPLANFTVIDSNHVEKSVYHL